MAIFLVDTWVPLRGKEEENEEVVEEILGHGAKHPELFKYVKSLRYFKQGVGGKPPGRRVLITEFNSLSDMDAFFKEVQKDPEWKKISSRWKDVMDQATVETMIWNDLNRRLWTGK